MFTVEFHDCRLGAAGRAPEFRKRSVRLTLIPDSGFACLLDAAGNIAGMPPELRQEPGELRLTGDGGTMTFPQAALVRQPYYNKAHCLTLEFALMQV